MTSLKSNPVYIVWRRRIDRRFLKDWQHVVSVYYPSWRLERRWSLQAVERQCLGRYAGMCVRSRRLILIRQETLQRTPDERRALLIHEIAHATTAGGHCLAWRLLMAEIARRAIDLDDRGFANQLRQDYGRWTNPANPPSTVESRYDRLLSPISDAEDLFS